MRVIFRAMLFGSMKESQSNMSHSLENSIKIPDITPNAFDFLIKYIHGLNPPITTDIVVDVLYLSKKYLINPIELACTKRLQSMFASIDSVNVIFGIASKLHALSMDVCDVFLKIVCFY